MRTVLIVVLIVVVTSEFVNAVHFRVNKPGSSSESTKALDCSKKPPSASDSKCDLSGGRCFPTGCPCPGGKIRPAGKNSGCRKGHGCCIPNGAGYMMEFDPTAKTNKVGQDQYDNVALIKEECEKQDVKGDQLAYVLATTTYESFLRPIEEYGVCSGTKKKYYCPYSGRGFVQLTHKKNYQKVSDLIGKDLVADPDLAMDPNIAKYVICYGMKTGLFTGRKLSDFINPKAKLKDYMKARRIINGDSGAAKFAEAAKWWEQEIAGTYSLTVVPGPYVVEASESTKGAKKKKSKL